MTLNKLNQIAQQYGLELLEKEGCFQWLATQDGKTRDAINYLASTKVYARDIKHLTDDQWMIELNSMVFDVEMTIRTGVV